ncbi:MAG: hypothetical protein ACK4SY_00240 [Pyrobaculum sp.]
MRPADSPLKIVGRLLLEAGATSAALDVRHIFIQLIDIMALLTKVVAVAAVVAAVLLTIQAAYASGVPKAGGPPPWAAASKKQPAWANVTLYVKTARLSIVGDRITVDLTVDVLTPDPNLPYGKVVYGSGDVVINGVRYVVKSIEGRAGRDGAKLEIYTGRELVEIRYYNGSYVVEIRTFGKPGFEKYGGVATYTID